jgi:hypothetical protein
LPGSQTPVPNSTRSKLICIRWSIETIEAIMR